MKNKSSIEKYSYYIGVFVILSLIILTLIFKILSVAEFVQSFSVIALVIITAYYAIQTKRLVSKQDELIERQDKVMQDERDARFVNFAEKRIDDFYFPFNNLMIELIEKFHDPNSDIDQLNEIRKKAKYLLWKKGYMISSETMKTIIQMEVEAHIAEVNLYKNKSSDEFKIAYEKWRSSEEKTKKILIEQWGKLEDEIRKIKMI